MIDNEGGNWPDVELFDAISQQAVKAAGVDVGQRVVVRDLASFGMPESVLLIASDGTHQLLAKDDPKRRHNLLSCQDVIKFVNSGIFTNPIVWIGETGICVTEDADRLRSDMAAVKFVFTDMYQAISKLGSTDGYTQSEFLKLLRVNLARAFTYDSDRLGLIQKVRSIIKREQSMINKGSGSMEVGTFDSSNVQVDWEDSLRLQTTVFDDPDFSTSLYEVEVVLDVRPENRQMFVLSPVGSDLTKAVQESRKAMKEYIEAEVGDTNVFLGSP